VTTTSRLNTDQARRRESQTPSQEEKETYPRREIRHLLEMFDVLETTEFQDKDQGVLQKPSNVHKEIHEIKSNLDERGKERKGIALGLCQWKDYLLWYQGNIWIPNGEGI